MEVTLCCQFYHWSEAEVVWTKIIVQSAYTSVIERSLLKWNGCVCDVWMQDAVGSYCCHVTMFWNLIGTADFLAGEEQFELTEVVRAFLLWPGNKASRASEHRESQQMSAHTLVKCWLCERLHFNDDVRKTLFPQTCNNCTLISTHSSGATPVCNPFTRPSFPIVPAGRGLGSRLDIVDLWSSDTGYHTCHRRTICTKIRVVGKECWLLA